MGVKDWLKERRDAVVEIINRPVDVITDTTRTERRYKGGKVPQQVPGFSDQGDTQRVGSFSGGGGGGSSGGGGDNGAIERARQLEAQRLAEQQRQQQIETERIKQQQLKQQQTQQRNQTIRQAVVTSRKPTLSSGGTPIRNVQLGKDVAEYQKRAFKEAQSKGRNLSITEREAIAGDVLGSKPETPKGAGAKEMVEAINKTAKGDLSPKDFRGKELRFGFQGISQIYGGVKTGADKTKQFILEHKDNKLIDFFATTKTPQERTRDFFATHRSPQVALRDLYSSESKEVKKGILKHKDNKLIDFFATTKTPQERTRDFFATHRSPQEVIGQNVPISVLEKAGSIKIPLFVGVGGSVDVRTPVGMITDIETSRVQTAPTKSSSGFFFEKLAESNPITGDIQTAYKQSGKETARDFFTEKLGGEYTKAYTDIAEASLYKGGRLFAQKRDPNFTYQLPSRIIGGGLGKVGEFQLYAVPGVGSALFVSPFIEKGIKGKGALGGYVKAHPYETAFALGSVVVPSTLYATKRITTIAPTRKVLTPSFVEKQVYGISQGKQHKFSTYDIVGEYKPPRLKTVTSRFRQQLGLKPLSTKDIPAKGFNIQTVSPAIDNFPFQVVEKRTGSNILRYKTISGDSFPINPRVSKLSNVDDFLLRRYVEGKTGLPTSSETAKVFAPRGSDFQLSDISTIKTHKFNVKGKKTTFIDNRLYKNVEADSFKVRIGSDKTYAELDFGKVKFEAGKGKTTETSRALTRTKQIVDTPDYEVLKSETYFKDVTKPGARASGKTPKLTGEIYIKKEPILIDSVSDVTFINTADIVKTPLSKTFQVQKQVSPLAKIFPKIPPSKTITKLAPPSRISRVIPGAVPGAVTKSKFFGAQFAPQEDLTMTQKFTSIGATTQQPTILQGRIPSNQLKDLTFMKTNQQQDNILKLSNKGLTKTFSKTLTETTPKFIVKEQAKLSQKQQQKQQQKQLQKQQQKYNIASILSPTTKLPKKTKPPIPIPFRFKTSKQPKQRTGIFKVLGRRFGKFRIVGVARTPKGAFKLGKTFARKGLGRSFTIQGIKKQPFKLPGFRTKKEKIGQVYIQKTGKGLTSTLGSLGEKKEIQIFRQVKKKKKGGKKKK